MDADAITWKDRLHFFAVASEMMRRILVDRARARRAEKRGGNNRQVSLAEVPGIAVGRDDDLLALDEALRALAKVDERKAKVVELRFFGGLSVEESAELLEISPQSVLRDWKPARAWLHRTLKHQA